MNIELFMTSVDQEFSAGTVTRMLGGTEATSNATGQGAASWESATDANWTNWSNWMNWTNWVNYSSGERVEEAKQASRPIIDRLKLRPEEFGGLAFDPPTRRIFKVDHDAYEALLLLKEHTPSATIAQRLNVDDEELKLVQQFLGGFDEIRHD